MPSQQIQAELIANCLSYQNIISATTTILLSFMVAGRLASGSGLKGPKRNVGAQLKTKLKNISKSRISQCQCTRDDT